MRVVLVTIGVHTLQHEMIYKLCISLVLEKLILYAPMFKVPLILGLVLLTKRVERVAWSALGLSSDSTLVHYHLYPNSTSLLLSQY